MIRLAFFLLSILIVVHIYNTISILYYDYRWCASREVTSTKMCVFSSLYRDKTNFYLIDLKETK